MIAPNETSTQHDTYRPNRTEEGLRLPDFMIVGAAKCGTTTLYQHLQRHPSVFMSTPKEMSFFSKPEVYQKGLDWYAQLFEPAGEQQRCGEASTTYSRWPTHEGTADRIADTTPRVKLLYLLRNPVDRLYSFYAHRMRERVTAPINQFLQETPEAIHSGLYLSQIEEIERRFPREQLMVLLLEDLKRDPAGVLSRVADYLELPPFDFSVPNDLVANRGSGHFAATQSLTATLQHARRIPLVGQAARLLPKSARDRAFRWLQHGPIGKRLRARHTSQMAPLTPPLRSQLYQHFKQDIAGLEKRLDRDLSDWKEPDTAGDVL